MTADRTLRLVGGMIVAMVGAIQAPGVFVDPSGHLKLGEVASFIAITGAAWAFLVWAFLPKLRARARELRLQDKPEWGADVMIGLEDATVEPRLRRLIEKTFADRIPRVDNAVESAKRNTERLDDISGSVARAAAALEQIPALEHTMAEVNKTLGQMQRTFAENQVYVARMDERIEVIRDAQARHYEGVEKRHGRGRRAADSLNGTTHFGDPSAARDEDDE